MRRARAEALADGDEPFGSVLVSGDGDGLLEDRNRVEDGLGPIVYAGSSEQLAGWLTGWGAPPAPVAPLPVHVVASGVATRGPVPVLAEEVRELHRRRFEPRTTPGSA